MKLNIVLLCISIFCFSLYADDESRSISITSFEYTYYDFDDVIIGITADAHYHWFCTIYLDLYKWDGSSWDYIDKETLYEHWPYDGDPHDLDWNDVDHQITKIIGEGDGLYKFIIEITVNDIVEPATDFQISTLSDNTAPSAPTNLSISNSGGNPKLDWDANSEEDFRRYRVYRVDGDPTSWIVSGSSYTDDEVEISQQGNYVIYEVKAEDWTSNLSSASNQDSIRGILGKPIAQNGSSLTDTYFLSQNYPNPFNPLTTIGFDIPEKAQVELQIFNIKGQIVSNLINTSLESGNYDVQFDAGSLPSGVYFYRITAGKYSDVKRMLLVK